MGLSIIASSPLVDPLFAAIPIWPTPTRCAQLAAAQHQRRRFFGSLPTLACTSGRAQNYISA